MTDNDSDRWDELERLAREALDAAEAPCSTCGSDIGPGADAYIAAAHPQAILDLVGALRTAEGRVAACSRPIRDTVSAYEVMLEECEAMEAERDALRAEVERLRKAEADWEAHDARECPGDQHCDTHCPGGEL